MAIGTISVNLGRKIAEPAVKAVQSGDKRFFSTILSRLSLGIEDAKRVFQGPDPRGEELRRYDHPNDEKYSDPITYHGTTLRRFLSALGGKQLENGVFVGMGNDLYWTPDRREAARYALADLQTQGKLGPEVPSLKGCYANTPIIVAFQNSLQTSGENPYGVAPISAECVDGLKIVCIYKLNPEYVEFATTPQTLGVRLQGALSALFAQLQLLPVGSSSSPASFDVPEVEARASSKRDEGSSSEQEGHVADGVDPGIAAALSTEQEELIYTHES